MKNFKKVSQEYSLLLVSYVHEYKLDGYLFFHYDHLLFVDRNNFHLNNLYSILVSYYHKYWTHGHLLY